MIEKYDKILRKIQTHYAFQKRNPRNVEMAVQSRYMAEIHCFEIEAKVGKFFPPFNLG